MLVMNSRNDTLRTQWNSQIKTKLERSEERRPTSTWGYWELIPSHKRR